MPIKKDLKKSARLRSIAETLDEISEELMTLDDHINIELVERILSCASSVRCGALMHAYPPPEDLPVSEDELPF